MKSIKTAVKILNCFTPQVPEIGVMEVARKLNMHKSRVSRIMSALEDEGLVLRNRTNKRYRLGSKVIELSRIFLSNVFPITSALQYMEEFRRKTNETVSLFILSGDCRICVERLESPQGVIATSRVGERYPLHAGAPGKLLLAYLPDQQRKQILERTELRKFTPNTITSKGKLKKELERISKQGFALSFEEHAPFATSIAVPIKNWCGEVIAALSVSGPVMRFNSGRIEKLLVEARRAANSISEEIGYDFGIEDEVKSGGCRSKNS